VGSTRSALYGPNARPALLDAASGARASDRGRSSRDPYLLGRCQYRRRRLLRIDLLPLDLRSQH
jgi:hypothetical protein